MSIVVATDFSPCSRAAVRLAAALARRQQVPLVMVHALEPPAVDVPLVPIGAAEWEQNLMTAAEVGVAHQASEIRQGGLVVETRVVIGSAESVILEVATADRSQMIVMGTHGRKRGAHLFLGSVAESVVRSAPCPVVVTREGGGQCWRQGPSSARRTCRCSVCLNPARPRASNRARCDRS